MKFQSLFVLAVGIWVASCEIPILPATETLYDVVYDGNGATSGSPPESHSFQGGSIVTVAGSPGSLSRSGFQFEDWSTDPSGTGTRYRGGQKFTLGAASLVLYAQWTAASHQVLFDSNGGSGTMTPLTINENSTANLGQNTYTRPNYLFTGWNTAANGSGVGYADQSLISMGTSGFTLYAQWSAIQNSVTFNANLGSGSLAAQIIAQGTSASLKANTFARTNYLFAGWNTEANGTGDPYADGASYTMGASSVVLYAQWTAITHVVTFHANGGVGTITEQTIAQGGSAALNPNPFTKSNFSFTGWNTSPDGTGTSYADGATFTMEASDLALYAQWTQIMHKVTFDANGGGGAMDDQPIAQGGSAALSKNAFSMSNASFLEWNTKSNGTGTRYGDGDSYPMGNADTTLFAIWGTDSQITFGFDWGTLAFSQTAASVTVGSSITLTPTFSGGTQWQWYVDNVPDLDQTGSSFTFTPEDVGVYFVSVAVVRNQVAYSASLKITVGQ